MMKAAFLKQWTLFLATLILAVSAFAKGAPQLDVVALNQLPAEAQYTLKRIKRGGPFPYAKDGVVFGNY